ncbi:hypothetical protein MMPV_007506 [Pyropia vietnamensis]
MEECTFRESQSSQKIYIYFTEAFTFRGTCLEEEIVEPQLGAAASRLAATATAAGADASSWASAATAAITSDGDDVATAVAAAVADGGSLRRSAAAAAAAADRLAATRAAEAEELRGVTEGRLVLEKKAAAAAAATAAARRRVEAEEADAEAYERETDAIEAAAATAVAEATHRADRYAALLGVSVYNAPSAVLMFQFTDVDERVPTAVATVGFDASLRVTHCEPRVPQLASLAAKLAADEDVTAFLLAIRAAFVAAAAAAAATTATYPPPPSGTPAVG